MEMLDLGAGRDTQLGIEVRQRLVHQEDIRLAHDSARQRHPLTLAARQRCRAPVQEIIQLDHRGGAAHTLVMRRRIDVPYFQRKADVLVDIHVRVQAIGLEHHGDIPVLRLKVVHHLAVDLDIAAGDLLETGDHPHGRGLAAARRPEQHEELLVRDIQIEIIDGDEVTPSLGQVSQSDLSHLVFLIP